jgi:tubulin polyglutamylase TTLL9
MSHLAFHFHPLHPPPLSPGYDLIIDQDLKPWLLEVNASPSLSANTKEDYLMKCEMLNGMLDVVDMEGVLRGDEEHVSGA